MNQLDRTHRVVVIGGGFGGLQAVRGLRRAPVDLTLVDRRNHHLFQPLLYQVATGALSAGEIAQPLRSILRKGRRNTRVLLGEAIGRDPERHLVHLSDGGDVPYDTLIVATGAAALLLRPRRVGDPSRGLKSSRTPRRSRAGCSCIRSG